MRYQGFKKKDEGDEENKGNNYPHKKKKKKDDEDNKGKIYLQMAEMTLRCILLAGQAKVIAISATPQKIRERFGSFCYTVPFDRSDIHQLETFSQIPYGCDWSSILNQFAPSPESRKTGIFYITEITNMKEVIRAAREIGIRANGFWSIHADTPMEEDQLALRRTVLDKETIPDDIDLLVINAASETCIKIKEENRKVDYMIIHSSNDEIKTQVRGRYHGDLPILYYHDIEGANLYSCANLPDYFLNKRLYAEDQNALIEFLKCQNPKQAKGTYYSMRKIGELLKQSGFRVDYKKDSKNGGKHYYVITR